jgi:hypothetical protein
VTCAISELEDKKDASPCGGWRLRLELDGELVKRMDHEVYRLAGGLRGVPCFPVGGLEEGAEGVLRPRLTVVLVHVVQTIEDAGEDERPALQAAFVLTASRDRQHPLLAEAADEVPDLFIVAVVQRVPEALEVLFELFEFVIAEEEKLFAAPRLHGLLAELFRARDDVGYGVGPCLSETPPVFLLDELTDRLEEGDDEDGSVREVGRRFAEIFERDVARVAQEAHVLSPCEGTDG